MKPHAWSALLAALLLGAAQHAAGRAPAAPRADGTAPPSRLVDTGLYAEGEVTAIAAANRPFSPQYPLWSDGAVKKRWVFVPQGARIDTSGERWDFPAGTRFWKEFSFNGRRVETRFLWKTAASEWVAASYVWNPEGTDAVLAPDDGVPALADIAAGRRHNIPSRSDCAACHGPSRAPLGFNALQLSIDRDPNAVHAEPLTASMVTMDTLILERRMVNPADANRMRAARIATADPLARAALGYLSSNCGTCHDGSPDISARVPSLTYAAMMRDGDAVARSLIGQPSKWQAPGQTAGPTMLIDPHAPEASAILLRMRSRRPSTQMPPLGTVIKDEAAIDAISRWIATLGPAK